MSVDLISDIRLIKIKCEQLPYQKPSFFFQTFILYIPENIILKIFPNLKGLHRIYDIFWELTLMDNSKLESFTNMMILNFKLSASHFSTVANSLPHHIAFKLICYARAYSHYFDLTIKILFHQNYEKEQ